MWWPRTVIMVSSEANLGYKTNSSQPQIQSKSSIKKLKVKLLIEIKLRIYYMYDFFFQ